MNELEKQMEQLEKDMRAEGVSKLKTLKPNNLELVDELKNGTLYTQDVSVFTNKKNKLRPANEAELEVVKKLEADGYVTYFITMERKEYSIVYNFFYVGYDKSRWDVERSALKKYNRQYREPFVYRVETNPKGDNDPIDTLMSKFTTMQINLD